MSLLSLKRDTPALDKKRCDADEFINGAVAYANGQNVIQLAHQSPSVHTQPEYISPPADKQEPMTRHCFTLDEESKNKLQRLADSSGISRSEVIRRCLKNQPAK